MCAEGDGWKKMSVKEKVCDTVKGRVGMGLGNALEQKWRGESVKAG